MATAPAHWASYLINGDASAFDLANTPSDPSAGDRELQLAQKFETYMGGPVVDVSEETFFSSYCDALGRCLAQDMATYTALTPSSE